MIRALVSGSREDSALRDWLQGGTDLAMSTVAWAELLCGPLSSEDLEAVSLLIADRLPFDDRDAALAANLFNAAGRRTGSLADCMIAAAALSSEATIATSNPRDFRPFESSGLKVIAP